MPPKIRIRRVPRDEENICLDQNGEIVRELAFYPDKLRSDFLYLDERAYRVFNKIFQESNDDETLHNRPANVLRRAVYSLGCQLIDTGNQNILANYNKDMADAVSESRVTKAAPDVQENPFHNCYMLLLGVNRLRKGEERLVKRDQISKSSRLLVYAQKNDVPVEYVIGFIAQVGGDTILNLHRQSDWTGWRTAKRVDKKKKT